jgi:hypothetical protein
MYDADIQSMDAAAKGARSWMAPSEYRLVYDSIQHKSDMGSYMIGVTQNDSFKAKS